MNSILASNTIEKRGGFWARQFGASATSGQVVFDVVFGILMPVFCFCFDPGIIRGTESTFSESRVFIYGFSGIAIFTMSIWLGCGQRMRSLTAVFGGVLLAGALISFAIGVIIFPLTLIGILFVIGLLGLVPFVTGFVYLRNALRAIRQTGSAASRSLRVATVVFSAVMAIALPGAAQLTVTKMVNQSIAEILDQNSGSVDVPIARIKKLHLVVDTDPIVREYENESSTLRRERLSQAYKEITGGDIDKRVRALND